MAGPATVADAGGVAGSDGGAGLGREYTRVGDRAEREAHDPEEHQS